MRIPRKILWCFFFAISIFLWIIFFEYGWQPKAYLNGAREELSKIFAWMARALDR